MVVILKTVIQNFPFDYFTTAYAERNGLENSDISRYKGIKNPGWINECKEKFREFQGRFEYSKENVETFFNITFRHLRIERSKILRFEDPPLYGKNIVYVYRK